MFLSQLYLQFPEYYLTHKSSRLIVEAEVQENERKQARPLETAGSEWAHSHFRCSLLATECQQDSLDSERVGKQTHLLVEGVTKSYGKGHGYR